MSELLFWDDALQRQSEDDPEDEALALYANYASMKTFLVVHSFRHELPTFIISGDNRARIPSLGLISKCLDINHALPPSWWIK